MQSFAVTLLNIRVFVLLCRLAVAPDILFYFLHNIRTQPFSLRYNRDATSIYKAVATVIVPLCNHLSCFEIRLPSPETDSDDAGVQFQMVFVSATDRRTIRHDGNR